MTVGLRCALPALLVLSACGQQAPPAPPPPEVGIIVAQPTTIETLPRFPDASRQCGAHRCVPASTG